MPADVANRGRHRFLILADDFSKVLGVQTARERGRADQIAEHQRDLATLRLRARGAKLRAHVSPVMTVSDGARAVTLHRVARRIRCRTSLAARSAAAARASGWKRRATFVAELSCRHRPAASGHSTSAELTRADPEERSLPDAANLIVGEWRAEKTHRLVTRAEERKDEAHPLWIIGPVRCGRPERDEPRRSSSISSLISRSRPGDPLCGGRPSRDS